MAKSKCLTIQLSNQDYTRLASQAEKLSLPLDVLVQRLLHVSLDNMTEPALDKQKAKAALVGLREISNNLSPVDAVAIARQSREDLEQRSIL